MEGSIGFTGLLEGDIECGGGSGVTPHVTATASVDASTGTPTVTVVRSGPDSAPNFDFIFQNLKGSQGVQGERGIQGLPGVPGIPGERGPRGFTGNTGETGPQGDPGETPTITAQASVDANIGTPSVSVIQSGTTLNPNFEFEFHNLKGVPGADSTVPGPQGPAGPEGSPGAGIATGGTIGQFLKKAGVGDYLTEWGDITAAEVGLDIEDCQIVTETNLQGAVEELDAGLVAVNASLTKNVTSTTISGLAVLIIENLFNIIVVIGGNSSSNLTDEIILDLSSRSDITSMNIVAPLDSYDLSSRRGRVMLNEKKIKVTTTTTNYVQGMLIVPKM